MRKTTIGIDPGNTHSALAIVSGETVKLEAEYLSNKEFLNYIRHCRDNLPPENTDFVCEMIASYGMAVGKTVFETCVFIGEIKALVPSLIFVTRVQVKATICHSVRAKDGNVRQALIDIYGPQGRKKAPGPTFGFAGDKWAALAVATAYRHGCGRYRFETQRIEELNPAEE